MFGDLFGAISVGLTGGGWLLAGSSGPGLSTGRDILFNSWIGGFTLRVPLSTQFKWVQVNLMQGVILQWNGNRNKRGVEINLAAPCHGNRDKFQPNEPIGSYSDLTLLQN